MNNRWLRALLGGLLIGLLVIPSVWAGQVVTEMEKNWARQALAQEAALDTAQMPPNSLAVLNFTNTTGQPALDPPQKGLAYMLVTDLLQLKKLVVVEREKLRALIEEMDLARTDLVATGSAPRVGRLLGARFLVSGAIAAGPGASYALVDEGSLSRILETKVEIIPGVLDVPDGQHSPLASVRGPLNQLFQMEKEALFAIIDHLKITLSEDEKARLSVHWTTNGRALYLFFMGLTYSDMGMYKQAGKHYEKAIQEDPGFSLAHKALDELKQLGLYVLPKAVKPLLRSLRNRTSLTDAVALDDVVRRARTPYDVELRQRLKPKSAMEMDLDGDGYTPLQGDCNDTNATIYPGATEICGDGIDQDCSGADQACEKPIDVDGDGYSVDQADCDDNNAAIYPGAIEIQCDGIDQDCDGEDYCPPSVDADSDGYTVNQDCNDNDSAIYPGAEEVSCDGIDQDCDGLDLCLDGDQDGYNLPADCNDNNAAIHPGAQETMCDGIDQDCDGSDLCPDADQDGYNVSADCNDNNAAIHPGAQETMCDGIDQDCDGSDLCPDADQDGYNVSADCNDNNAAIHPGAQETMCDGIDQDCDGSDLCPDADQDGYNVLVDCNDYNASIYPGATERCGDGIDQDCDGTDLSCASVDFDGDGYSRLSGDCNDSDPTIHPGAVEDCSSVDRNCNGDPSDAPNGC